MMETKLFKLKAGRFYLKATEWQGFYDYVAKKWGKRLILHHTIIGPEDEVYESIKEMYNQQGEPRHKGAKSPRE